VRFGVPSARINARAGTATAAFVPPLVRRRFRRETRDVLDVGGIGGSAAVLKKDRHLFARGVAK